MNIYDVLIIGGGPAGLTAAIYTSRAKFKTLILEKMIVGGQVTTTHEVENYPGFAEPINGFLLMDNFQRQAKRLGTEIITGVEVKSISMSQDIFEINSNKDTFYSRALIIASGARYKKLGIKGESQYIGRGVSYCATCDGAFFRNMEVAVIGGGNSALEEAIFLTKFVSKVYIIHRRGEFRADKIVQERVSQNSKIELLLNSVPLEIKGGNVVEKIVIQNKISGDMRDINVSGVFVFIGLDPNTEFIDPSFIESKDGYLIVDSECKTNRNGCFAAGDAVHKSLRQIATAVGDGAVAANSVKNYLEKLGI